MGYKKQTRFDAMKNRFIGWMILKLIGDRSVVVGCRIDDDGITMKAPSVIMGNTFIGTQKGIRVTV